MTVAPVSYKCWDHPDLVAGYDPSDTFEQGGAKYIRDKSGNGKHMLISGEPPMMPSVLPAKRMDGGKGIYLSSPNYGESEVGEISEGTLILFCNLNHVTSYDNLIAINDGTTAESIAWLNDSTEHNYAGITAVATGATMLFWNDGVASGPTIIPRPINETRMYVLSWKKASTIRAVCYPQWTECPVVSTASNPVNTTKLTICKRQGTAQYYNGVYDNILYFNRQLSDAELRKIWDSAMALPRVWGVAKTGVKGTPVNLCRATDMTDDPYWPAYWATRFGGTSTVQHKVEDGYDVIELNQPAATLQEALNFIPGASISKPNPLSKMLDWSGGKDADYMTFDAKINYIPDYFYIGWSPASDPNPFQWVLGTSQITSANKWLPIKCNFNQTHGFDNSDTALGMAVPGMMQFWPVFTIAKPMNLKLRNIRFGKYGWNVIDFDRAEDANKFTSTRLSDGGQSNGQWSRTIENSKLVYRATSGGTENNYWGLLDKYPVNLAGDFIIEMKCRHLRTDGSFGRFGIGVNNTASTPSLQVDIDLGGAAYLDFTTWYAGGQDRIITNVGSDVSAILRIIRRNGVLTYEVDYGGSTIVMSTRGTYTTTISNIVIFVEWYQTVDINQPKYIDWIRWREL